MPHQCVRCNTFYEDGAKEILEGCSCGARLFFYIKKERLQSARQEMQQIKLSKEDKEQIEEDVYELIGVEKPEEIPVILDFEAVRVLAPGKYELDLVNLFKKQPLIVKLEEGKYFVDVAETFKLEEGKRKKK